MSDHDRVESALAGVLDAADSALRETEAYLSSPETAASLARDPYWPKWNTPWWRITVLAELDLAERVPPAAARALLEAARARYIDHFPFREEDVPSGVDPVRGILCHCALGTLDRVLSACGLDVDRELPWVRGWYRKYALPDGGYNCDEAVYVRSRPTSSMVSTLPPLEALLSRGVLTAEDEAILDGGARYLLDRKLCRSLSKGGALIDPAWLEPTFPRFYNYDVLRGLTFVSRWAERRGRRLPAAAVVEAVEALSSRTSSDGTLPVARRAWQGEGTRAQASDGAWTRGHTERSFPLLEQVSRLGRPSARLTAEWHATARRLATVTD